MLKNALRVFIFLLLQLNVSKAVCQVLPSHYLIKPDKTILKSNMNLGPAQISASDATSSVMPPDIRYETPQNYVLNQPINVLTPINKGGAVPAAVYGQLSTVSSSFGTVTGVAIDAAGNVYVADWDRHQIMKINPAGKISLFAGSANAVSGATNGQGSAARLNQPDALLFDNSGNLYVGDQGNNMIRKITPSGLVSTLAGNGTQGTANGTGTEARFYIPRGMTIDRAGNLYVADQGNNLIRKITPGKVVSTYAGNGTTGFINGTRLSATFNSPTAVEVDAEGNLYISDSGNGAIRKITTEGIVSTLVTGLRFPRELRVDETGNIYVAEQEGYSIKRISPTGSVSTIVSGGLSGPIGLMFDGNGNLFLGDVNSVRKVSISGYTLDKPLPPGLKFDRTTGIISGTPTALSPPVNYTITAYNGGGSSTAAVTIAVGLTAVLKQSIITLPPQRPDMLDANDNYDPMATSTNHETSITYTSSNPSVAIITPEGLIHVLGPGVSIITAYQKGNDDYADAIPVQQTLTVVEYLSVSLPEIAVKTVCDADFSAGATAFETKIPLTYSSSNTAVATISDQGIIHITGPGTTTITVSQNADPPLYVSAVPQSKTFTVTLPMVPALSVAAQYAGSCIGSQIIFTATADNKGSDPVYQWMVNGTNAGTDNPVFTSNALADGDIVTCTCTNTDNSCITGFPTVSNAVKVTLTTPSEPTVNITASVNGVFPGVPITFTATVSNVNGIASYHWRVNDNDAGTDDPVFTSNTFVNGDIVTCTITSDAACSTPATSGPVKVRIVYKLEIPNTFTPNGDGINDTWNISGIANYPNCLVNIYNRYGTLVYRSKGYKQAWDGTVNGSGAPVSTYYYVIDLGNEGKKLSGGISLIR